MKKKILVILLPMLLAFAGASSFAGTETILVLKNGAGQALFSQVVSIGVRFSIVFIHSLALSRVEEIYEITGPDEFHLRETIYEDFGSGLPHMEQPGQRMEFANGRIRLSGYNLRFRELHLRVGYISDHRLTIGGIESAHLVDLERPGGEIRICVTRSPPESADGR